MGWTTVIASTTSGGVTVNDVLTHAIAPNAPFGGVGESGHGAYHGAYGFKAFSHMRVIARPRSLLATLTAFKFPPYSAANVRKLVVKNRLGFRRGETMADQETGGLFIRLAKALFWPLKVLSSG
jgi:aldehyde dehydrogenase (NAD+)